MKKLIPLVSTLGLAFAPFEGSLITPYLEPKDHYRLSCTSKDKARIPNYYWKITEIHDNRSNEFCDYNQVTIKVSLPRNSCEIQLPLSIENNLKAGQYIDPKTMPDIMFHNKSECVLKLRPYRKHYDVGDVQSCDIADLPFYVVNVTCIFDNSSSPKAKFQELIENLINLNQKLYQDGEELESNAKFVDSKIKEYKTDIVQIKAQ